MIVVADKKAWDEIHADAKKNKKTVSAQCLPCIWSFFKSRAYGRGLYLYDLQYTKFPPMDGDCSIAELMEDICVILPIHMLV